MWKKNWLLISVMVFIISVVIWNLAVQNEKAEILENHEHTYGTLVSFTDGSMGKHYIDYQYVVGRDTFYQSTYIEEKFVDENLVGITDLKIKYAISDHSISEINDSRFD